MKKDASKKHALQLTRLVVGPLEVNCYIAVDAVTREAFIIDPGGDGREINAALQKLNAKLSFIINTHGHGDHIIGDDAFAEPLYIHPDDVPFLTDPKLNMSEAFSMPLIVNKKPKLLKDGQRIPIGDTEIGIIHTPGHTPGSVSVILDNVIFSGDTLFNSSIGRTDLPGGDHKAIIDSIKTKLLRFKDDTLVLPGHGEPTTIGDERVNNPFLDDMVI